MTITLNRRLRRSNGTPRWRQFTDALLCRHDHKTDQQIRSLLGDDRQWALVARLTPYDRKHSLRVYDRLMRAGHADPDLLRAALLHDIGKADGHARVGTSHRVLRVLLRRFWPGLLRWLATERKLSYRLYLAEHHASLGASAARSAGASERCCLLIAAHENPDADHTDRELLALIAADEGEELP